MSLYKFIIHLIVIFHFSLVFDLSFAHKNINKKEVENKTESVTLNSIIESMFITPYSQVSQKGWTTTPNYFMRINTPFNDRKGEETTTSIPLMITTTSNPLMIAKSSQHNEETLKSNTSFQGKKSYSCLFSKSESIEKVSTKPKRVKLSIFLVVYAFYMAFELMGYILGYYSNDTNRMIAHLVRSISFHMKIAAVIVYLLRAPFIIIYFSLIIAHPFVCIKLIERVPNELLPIELEGKKKLFFQVYYLTLRTIGLIVGFFGGLQAFIRAKLLLVKSLENPIPEPNKKNTKKLSSKQSEISLISLK
jgi:hypothetical protein